MQLEVIARGLKCMYESWGVSIKEGQIKRNLYLFSFYCYKKHALVVVVGMIMSCLLTETTLPDKHPIVFNHCIVSQWQMKICVVRIKLSNGKP